MNTLTRRELLAGLPVAVVGGCSMARPRPTTQPAPAGLIRMRIFTAIFDERWEKNFMAYIESIESANRVFHAADIEFANHPYMAWRPDGIKDVSSLQIWLDLSENARLMANNGDSSGIYVALVSKISWPGNYAAISNGPTSPTPWGIALAYPGGPYTLAHELGHLFGLNHTDDKQNVMNIDRDSSLLPHLDADQIACVRAWAVSDVRKSVVIK